MSVIPDDARPVSRLPDQRELCSCVVTSSPAEFGEVVLLRVRGEIDLYTVGVVEDALAVVLRGRPAQLVVDLAGVTFCGLRGLALMVRTAAAAAEQGLGFSVCGASSQSVGVWARLWSAAEQPTRHPDATAGMLAAAARQASGRRVSARHSVVPHRVAELAGGVGLAERGLGVA